MSFLDTVKGWFGIAPPLTPEEITHRSAIANKPDDFALRRAYADYLIAQKNPYGEYLSIHMQLAELGEDDPQRSLLIARSEQLMGQHGKRWVRAFKEMELEPRIMNMYVPDIWFERGMIEQLIIDKRSIIPGKFERVIELAPALNMLTFERCSPDWQAISNAPQMSRIKTLVLSDVKMKMPDIRLLLASPHLKNLETLDLSEKEYGVELVEALAKSTQVRNLRSIKISSCHLPEEAGKLLGNEANFGKLQRLDIAYNKLGDAGIQALASGSQLQGLKALRVSSNDFTTEGLEALAKAHFPAIEELEVESSRSELAGFSALGKAPWLATLKKFDLGWCRGGDAGLAALLSAGKLTKLRHLAINGNDLTAAGAHQLARAPQLANLEELDLSSNEISDAGALALADSPHLNKLHTLQLYSIELGSDAKQKLVKRFGEDAVKG